MMRRRPGEVATSRLLTGFEAFGGLSFPRLACVGGRQSEGGRWRWEIGQGLPIPCVLSAEATSNRAFQPGRDALPRVPHISPLRMSSRKPMYPGAGSTTNVRDPRQRSPTRRSGPNALRAC